MQPASEGMIEQRTIAVAFASGLWRRDAQRGPQGLAVDRAMIRGDALRSGCARMKRSMSVDEDGQCRVSARA